MSGHSKWATIKHKKGAADAKRGQMFTKLIREITVAAKDGGGDPNINSRLRTAIGRAKEANMGSDNIKTAIQKGTGELPGVVYESASYEGYAQGGVAIIVDTLADNKNRSSAEIRNIFSKRGGNLAGAGSVAWQFASKGYILINKSLIAEDDLFNLVIDAGAENIETSDEGYEIYCEMKDFEKVKAAVTAKGLKWEEAEMTKIPSTKVKIEDVAIAKQILGLIESLEEHDDVQKVYANFDMPDSVMEEAAKDM
jgi:YebC/PmpR family DNA-binding regulatory protein